MTITYSAVLTNAGAALYAAALASGTPIVLSTMAVGDGGGSPIASPDPTRTSLVNQVFSTNISALTVDQTNHNLQWSQMIIPPSSGGYTIREVGVFTSTGVLYAISNYPDTIKSVSASGSTNDLIINIGMLASNTALVTVNIDPSVVTATQSWVSTNITFGNLVPGGTQYQTLQKNSSTNGDASWVDPQSPWEYALTTTGGATTITALQAYNKLIKVSGVLGSNATLTFPAQLGKWTILNDTTGPFTLTAIAAGGQGVSITQGQADTVHFDAGNLVYSHGDVITRAQGDSSIAIANTAFVSRAINAVNGYYQDVGAANAYVINPSPAIASYTNGQPIKFRALNGNTGACTINAGPGAISLLRSDGTPMQKGDIFPGMMVNGTADSATGAVLMNGLVQSQLYPTFGLLTGGNQWSGGQGSTPVPVAYAASIALDFTKGNNFVIGTLTLGVVTGGITGNFAMAAPTLGSANYGQSGWITVVQDGTGGRTISSWASAFLATGGAYPNLTGTSNKRDEIYYQIDYDGKVVVGARNNVG